MFTIHHISHQRMQLFNEVTVTALLSVGNYGNTTLTQMPEGELVQVQWLPLL